MSLSSSSSSVSASSSADADDVAIVDPPAADHLVVLYARGKLRLVEGPLRNYISGMNVLYAMVNVNADFRVLTNLRN